MKNSMLKGLALLLMCGTAFPFTSKALTTNQDNYFYCDFSTQEEYDQWTPVDVNGPGENMWDQWSYDGGKMTAVMRAGDNPADDWLFSPKVTITEGGEYIFKVKAFGDWPCKITLTSGTSADPAAQTAMTENIGFENWKYVAGTVTLEPGEYSLGIYSNSEGKGYLYIHSCELMKNTCGSATVTLTHSETNQPLEGIDLTLRGDKYEFTVATSAEGTAQFDYLTPGDYTVGYDVEQYVYQDPTPLHIAEKENTTVSLTASPLSYVTVTGTVKDEWARPVDGIDVKLIGRDTYTTFTDADGNFVIEDVKVPANYEIYINKLTKEPISEQIALTEENGSLGELTLKNFFGKPVNIRRDATEAGYFVSWLVPVGKEAFSVDNGNYGGMFTQTGDHITYVRYGNKFATPMLVDEVKWAVCDLQDGAVDVYVYAINPDGSLPTTPSYVKEKVPCQTYDWVGDVTWQTHKLDTPVEAPYGCIVAVGHSDDPRMRICTDYDIYNEKGCSMVSVNDGTDGWGQISMVGNFMIRANGTLLSRDVDLTALAADQYRAMSLDSRMGESLKMEGIGYNVWRIGGEITDDHWNWVPMGENIDRLYIFDKDFDNLEMGTYHYAVQAVSYDGTTSDICYSEPIAHRLSTDVTVNVWTNTAINYAEGAMVTLTAEDNSGREYQQAVADGKAYFKSLPKGAYTVKVAREGFNTALYNEVYYDWYESYTSDVELTLIAAAPFALKAEQTDEPGEVVLSWNSDNGLFEDFENMEDFALNPAGDLGWSYVDGDGLTTFGVTMCQDSPYPNMHSPMAYMVMNPYATTPQITSYVRPFSGEKVLICANPETGEAADDYIFSPELQFDTPFTLSFQAASAFYAALGREEFMVGYTTSDATPENVVWLTENPVTVGGVWEEFSYRIPAEARHTVIRCVSKYHMFFMLDDIFIGLKEPETMQMATFELTIDGEQVAKDLIGRSYTLTGLEEGKHLAQVITAYPLSDYTNMYSEATELLFKVEGVSGLTVADAEQLYTFNRPTRTITAGSSVVNMEVYDIQGRKCYEGTTITLSETSGVYVLKVITADNVITRKIIL